MSSIGEGSCRNGLWLTGIPLNVSCTILQLKCTPPRPLNTLSNLTHVMQAFVLLSLVSAPHVSRAFQYSLQFDVTLPHWIKSESARPHSHVMSVMHSQTPYSTAVCMHCSLRGTSAVSSISRPISRLRFKGSWEHCHIHELIERNL